MNVKSPATPPLRDKSEDKNGHSLNGKNGNSAKNGNGSKNGHGATNGRSPVMVMDEGELAGKEDRPLPAPLKAQPGSF